MVGGGVDDRKRGGEGGQADDEKHVEDVGADDVAHQ